MNVVLLWLRVQMWAHLPLPSLFWPYRHPREPQGSLVTSCRVRSLFTRKSSLVPEGRPRCSPSILMEGPSLACCSLRLLSFLLATCDSSQQAPVKHLLDACTAAKVL